MFSFQNVIDKYKNKSTQSTSPSQKFTLVGEQKPGLSTPAPKPGATLSAAPTKIGGSALTDKLPQPVKEAFFGTGRRYGDGVKDTGLFGFMYGGLSRTDEDSFTNFYDSLRSSGIEDRRAQELASQAVTNSLDKDTLTPEERKTLTKVSLLQKGETALDALDFIPVAGPTKNIAKEAFKLIAKETNPTAIKETLLEIAPRLKETEDIDTLSRSLTAIDDPKQVEKVINFTLEQNAPKKTTGFDLNNPPPQPKEPGKVVVAFERTGGDQQWVTTDYSPESIERLKIDPAKVELAVVDEGTLTLPSGLKGEFGERIVDRKVIDRLTRGADDTGLRMSDQTAQSTEPFANSGTLTTRILTQLEGKTAVDKQFITDLTNQGTIKQAERDVIRRLLDEYPEGKVNAKEFGEKVQAQLLPLDRINTADSFDMGELAAGADVQYENITLPDNLRGDVANYSETIYESPIKNSAGAVHFNGATDNYFAHTRIEDMADDTTRRVIEVQSDLFQKGRIADEVANAKLEAEAAQRRVDTGLVTSEETQTLAKAGDRTAEFDKLAPYRNTWWERIVREEVKKAAEDGKSILQFPTGETAMKIEGLGETSDWMFGTSRADVQKLKPEDLKVGMSIGRDARTTNPGALDDVWVVTEVLGDGKFKALPKNRYQSFIEEELGFNLIEVTGKGLNDARKIAEKKNLTAKFDSMIEQFDISGKVDSNNPIYKFYEKDVQKYLAKNYGATKVTDANGVSWIQLNVDPKYADKPVEAFAGAIAGIEEDENGDIQVDPTKAFLGIAAAGILRKGSIGRKGSSQGTPDGLRVDASRPGQQPLPEKTSLPTKGQTRYPLTTEKLSDSLSTEYQKVAGKSIDTVDSTLSPTEINPKKLKEYSGFRKSINEVWTKVVENVQDDMYRVRQLVNDPAVKVSDDTDPYLAELLFHGRVGARLTEARDAVISVDKDIVSTAKRNGVPDSDMTLMVNKYLHARHAPERNAALGDGAAGLTTNDANEILGDIDSLPYADDVKRIAEDIQTLNNKSLEVLREAQVIDDELYTTLKTKYKNHVPLQRILDDTEDVGQALTSKGFDVRSTGIKRAKGSDRQVADILANVVTNYEQAIIRAEKNRVDLSTLQFARDNADLGLFKEIQPKAIGRSFGGGKPTGGDPELEAYFDPTRPVPAAMTEVVDNLRVQIEDAWGTVYGEMMSSRAGKRSANAYTDEYGLIQKITSDRSTFPDWVPEELRSTELFNKVLDLHEKGKVPRSNANQQRELLDVMEKRFMQLVPLDVQDELAMTYLAKESETMASIYEKAKAARGGLIYEQITDPTVLALRENGKPVYLKIADDNLAMALKGVSRHQVPPYMKFVQAFTRFYSGLQTRFNPEFAFPNKIRDLQEAVVYAGSRSELGFAGGVRAGLDQRAYKDVLDHLRGADTEGARIYKQMIEDGGTTGGMSLSTREQVELDIANIRKLNRSAPRDAAAKVIEYVDKFNQIFEDSTRLSLYKEAIDRGVSRKRAAMIAKEASVNFNKFGRGGPIINSLWMFSNASIQGTTKMLRAMKNPKVAATVTASVGSAVYATGEWNDRVDPDWRNKVTEWDRINSLVLVLPSEDDEFNYVSIPVGWGIKPIKVSMDYAYDLTQGKGESPKDIASGIMAAIVNSYNPVGGTDLFSSVMPTILDIPSEMARNKAWHGGKIKPDWDQNAPESIRYFSSLKDSTTGETAIQVSKGLSGIGIEISPADIYYAYQGYIGGAGRTATDFVNTMISAGSGELPEPNNIPVWSRFVRQRDNEEIGAASQEFEAIKKRLEEQSRERFYLNQDAEDAYAQLRTLPQEKAAAQFDEIAKRDPDLADKIADIVNDEKLGLTFSERLIKQLGVANGERAAYIYDKLEKLPTKEEKAALWDEYSEKGLITSAVSEQLMELYK